jgi:hypothetical protein
VVGDQAIDGEPPASPTAGTTSATAASTTPTIRPATGVRILNGNNILLSSPERFQPRTRRGPQSHLRLFVESTLILLGKKVK